MSNARDMDRLLQSFVDGGLPGCGLKQQHQHVYSNQWASDETNHWHPSTCEHYGLVSDKAAHTFDDGQYHGATFESSGFTVFTCTVCKYQKTVSHNDQLQHSYSDQWSMDDTSHWHACLDQGYTDLKKDEALHSEDNEVILKDVTDTETGLAQYTCGVCGHTYQKVLLIPTKILSMPTVVEGTYYVGQTLENVALQGGEGSVAGSFRWKDQNAVLTENGSYTVLFVPEDSNFSTLEATISLTAIQLTITVTTGEHGSASPSGVVKVPYGQDTVISFVPDLGYAVDTLLVDGQSVAATNRYVFENVTSSHTITASFAESDNAIDIQCLEGTAGAYTISGNTITFSNVSADSIYSISGQIFGNIVIDVDDAYQFELELRGLDIRCDYASPIVILGGDKVTLTAKKDYENVVTDLREAVDSEASGVFSGAIHAKCDLEIGGKGKLTVVSEHNNGIRTKDDLEIKNLTLSVRCADNALKGDDSVTIKSGNIELIATAGDGIKTVNTDISSKGKQRGIVTISGGVVNIYAACDGIDAAYDVVINENDAAVTINIYTDKYSEYSLDVNVKPDTGSDVRYIRFTNRSYKYSVQYYHAESGEMCWVDATYHSTVSGGRTTDYYYSFPVVEGYSTFRVFIYNDAQAQGQDQQYVTRSDYMSWNDAYDTFALSQRGSTISYNWTNYSTNVNDGPGGFPGMPGGGGGGMADGNTNKGSYSTKGIKAGNAITISGGNIHIQAYDDAIHANQESVLGNGSTPAGVVTIQGGSLELYSDDDGIHADGSLWVMNGTVNITGCYEGLEGSTVCIAGGEISIISLDDGVNATGSGSQTITIAGGTSYIYAKGDGIDSNSTASYNGILISGGRSVIICNSGMNSSIDSERGYQYTGGVVLALTGSSGSGGGMGGGMASESYNCSNFSSVGRKSTMSVSAGQYLRVQVGSDVVLTAKMPAGMSVTAVYLGNNGAKFSMVSASGGTEDANGVWWN